jgi:hypothetical protein
MSTIATLHNMKIHDVGRQPGFENVIAHSPITGEEYSAVPGNYWHMADDESLRDETGEPMILVRRNHGFTEV